MTKTLMARSVAVALGATLASGGALAQDLKFAPGEEDRFDWAGFEEYKAATDLSGEELTIFGPWTGPDADLVNQMLAYFEDATGASVTYTGSDSFEQQIVIDAQAGSPANIAVFPQPGLAANLASQGLITPLPEGSGEWMAENYAAGQSWVDLGTYPGEDGEEAFYAFPYKADVKSLVWYVPENMEDGGYEVPETMEDLKALTSQIVEDGGTPWCIGLGSGGATGWPATDWVEDMMLRTQPPEVYDQWVTNEIGFDDPRVIEAIEEFGYFALNEDFVAGGSSTVSGTDFRDSPKGLFDSPPKCYLHHQASFIPTFFPEGTEIGIDADFFYMPAYADKDLGKPVLGAGTMFSILDDSPAAQAFIGWLQQPIAHEVWMAGSGFLTPHTGVNPDAYADDTLRNMGAILTDASTFRFDASDMMPGKIGAGAFWTGMVDYVGGKSAEDVAAEVQRTWDALK